MTRTAPQLCGSISGRASPNALGVKMHEAGYAAAGLSFRYVSAESQDLHSTVGAFLELGFRGFGVSMPFKREILSLLDEVSPDTCAIGACNTVVNESGRLSGHNTDWRGAMAHAAPPGPAPIYAVHRSRSAGGSDARGPAGASSMNDPYLVILEVFQLCAGGEHGG